MFPAAKVFHSDPSRILCGDHTLLLIQSLNCPLVHLGRDDRPLCVNWIMYTDYIVCSMVHFSALNVSAVCTVLSEIIKWKI